MIIAFACDHSHTRARRNKRYKLKCYTNRTLGMASINGQLVSYKL